MKLRYVRNGHKSAVAKLTERFQQIREMATTEDINMNEVMHITQTLENRVKIIEELNTKIIDELKDEHEIDTEICETTEYILKVEMTIQNLKDYSASHNLNRNSNVAASSFTSSMQTHSLTFLDEFEPRTTTSSTHIETRGPILTPQSTTLSSSSYSKLPKLELPRFDGDIMEWNAFWDSYDSAVHANQTLTNAQKFNYLKSLLRNEPLQTVSGFSLTNTNYEKAVELLHERYGQKDRIIQTYMQTMLNLPAPSNATHSLRDFHDKLEIYIRGLESLGQSETTYGSLLVTVIMNKLPAQVHQNLIREHVSSNWTLGDLRAGLRKELYILEAGKPIVNVVPTATFLARSEPSRSAATHKPAKTYRPAQNAKTCTFCKGSHYTAECKTYSSYNARIDIVKRDKLCFNCLGHHRMVDCKSKSKCRTCNRKHHSNLCKDALAETTEPKKTTYTNSRSTTGAQNHNAKNSSGTSVLHSSFNLPQGQVLLKTAIFPVSSQTTCVDANILFDEGAQRSFVTEKMANILELERTGCETLQISGFGENVQRVRHLDTTVIHIQTENEDIPLNVLIVPEIAAPIQTYKLTSQNSTHLCGLKLAHPFMAEGQFEISVLVGADFYWNIVQDDVVRGNGPTAVQSKLGYLLSGPTGGYIATTSMPTTSTSMMHIMTSHEREEVNLEKFWEIETLGIDKKEITDHNYMSTYQNTCISHRDGKYHAKLPWKDEHSTLPTNETVAKQRTFSVINRLRKDPKVLKMYSDIISDQERRGFIEKVESRENEGAKIHYIPHHPVKKDSSTTPIRIVFDCSCKAYPESQSLNDCLSETPPSLNEITSILLRFRSQRYACTTDIEKAFLNIGLEEEDRDSTRFFWLSDPCNPNSDLKVYRFKSVLFGATCSPFILSATILNHLDLNRCEFTETLLSDLYVDNIISSFTDENIMLQYFETSRALFDKAGFNLRSWTSNSQTLRELAEKRNVRDKDEITKILGLRWKPENDTISFASKNALNVSQPDLTKREVLRQSSVIYDPLGIISTITVRAKIFMQLLWKQNIDWDQTLPENLKREWDDTRLDLIKGTETEIPRWYFSNISDTEDRVLHVFTDASQKAYGACAYIVSGVQSSLVMSKNRVAPVKPISIPRLELMGAVVGARLCEHILKNLKCSRVYLWSDSMIVLSWLKSTKKQPVFVSNRVAEIKELTKYYEWRYCPTKSNPADILSRGISANQFESSDLWMRGPEWITENENWPPSMNADETIANSEQDIQTNVHVNTVSESPSGIANIVDIDRFSSYGKLIRTTAYVLRFVENCRNRNRKSGPLSPCEINAASLTWIQCVQQRNYAAVIQNIEGNSKTIHTLVRQLGLFADENCVLRCRGRIHNAPLEQSVKFPYLLPPKGKFTDLVIMDSHIEILHAGVESTVTYLRQKFWIPAIRQRVKSIIHKCVKCRKVIGKAYRTPDPPPLPKDRPREAPPFTVTGVDYSGALHVRNKNGYTDKVYICLFTCAKTRAVHLEIVPNLTEDSFLLAFKRFVARKSVPQIMMSDNALTFCAAAKSVESMTESLLQQSVAVYGTVWKFIPQRAPWYGGWWERLIGLTKNSIRKVLGKACVSLEVLQTLIVEVECILNNRPLTHVSSNPLDQDPLTPAHLLYGRMITCLAYPAERHDEYSTNITHGSVNKLSKLQSQIIQHFFTRWKNEYLTSLREYHRSYGREGQDVNVGDVVLVHDETSRVNWPLGVIEDLTTGGDGFTRSAHVRTRRGVLCRPVAKLYPLEVHDKM